MLLHCVVKSVHLEVSFVLPYWIFKEEKKIVTDCNFLKCFRELSLSS